MTVLLGLLTRRRDLSRAAALDHWRDVHAPLAQRLPGLRHYTQHHALDPQPTGALPASHLDGIAEIWLEPGTSIRTFATDPAYLEGALADEPNFLDTDRLATGPATPYEPPSSRPIPSTSLTAIVLAAGTSQLGSDDLGMAASAGVRRFALKLADGLRLMTFVDLNASDSASVEDRLQLALGHGGAAGAEVLVCRSYHIA